MQSTDYSRQTLFIAATYFDDLALGQLSTDHEMSLTCYILVEAAFSSVYILIRVRTRIS
jgi:hypothetical protein